MWDTIRQRCVMLVTWPVWTILSIPFCLYHENLCDHQKEELFSFDSTITSCFFLQNDFSSAHLVPQEASSLLPPASFFIVWTLLLKVCPPNECILVTQIPVLNHHQYLQLLIPSHFPFPFFSFWTKYYGNERRDASLMMTVSWSSFFYSWSSSRCNFSRCETRYVLKSLCVVVVVVVEGGGGGGCSVKNRDDFEVGLILDVESFVLAVKVAFFNVYSIDHFLLDKVLVIFCLLFQSIDWHSFLIFFLIFSHIHETWHAWSLMMKAVEQSNNYTTRAESVFSSFTVFPHFAKQL